MHCREGHVDAAALLAHLDNMGSLRQETLKIVDIAWLEVHGPESGLAKLHGPSASLNPHFHAPAPGGLRR